MEEKTKIELVCRNCNYAWVYEGKSEYYATCPRCLRKVKVIKEEEKNE